MSEKIPSISKIWNISWPIMLGLVAQNIVGVTDTAFLGHVGEVELGASAIGGIFYITILMVAYGFTTGVQILIARRYGEKNFGAIGDIFENSLYFLSILSVIITLLIVFFGQNILHPFIASPNIFKASTVYLKYRIFGLFFASAVFLFRSFYTGIAFTKYISIGAAIMAGVNVVLDYGLIFGKLGLPQMGIAGAALASSISEVCAFVFFVIITASKKKLAIYRLFRFVMPDIKIIREILNISLYVMIQYVLSHAVWFLFFLLIEKMGEQPLAISNIIRSIYMLLMIPAWAVSSATSTLVSATIGEGFTNSVISVVRKILKFSSLIMLGMVLLAIFIPRFLLSIYTPDQQLVQASMASYYIVLGAVYLFSIAIVMFNGLLGTGNTRVGLVLEIGTLVIYIFVAWLLAVKLKQPIEIVWMCEYVYAIFMSLFAWLYLRYGKWQGKKI